MGHNKVTPSRLQKKKRDGDAITMLTAYDFPMAKFIQEAGVDVVLVSDVVGTVGLGRSEAVSVSLEDMIYHTLAVRNGVDLSMVVTTLPFGSYENPEQAVESAVRLLKEGHADGVHLEGTVEDAGKVFAIVRAGIPVMGHLGITKQKIVRSGAIRIQGRTAASAASILEDALAFARAGVFALVLECIPQRLAEVINRSLDIPTIGIVAGASCNGQALVTQDMLGLFKEYSPKFLKVYIDLSEVIVETISTFREEVEQGIFPTPEHSYSIDEDEMEELLTALDSAFGD